MDQVGLTVHLEPLANQVNLGLQDPMDQVGLTVHLEPLANQVNLGLLDQMVHLVMTDLMVLQE